MRRDYEFREVLVVREADRAKLRTLADLAGRRVGTLGGTIAYGILLRAGARTGLQAVAYEDDVHPYTDLALGRVDAVLLDNVIANRRNLTGLGVQPESVAIGHYVGVLGPGDGPLRDTMNEALRAAMRDGTLERIFRKWNVWNEDQPGLHARLLAGTPVPPVSGVDETIGAADVSRWEATRRYLPSLFKAAGVTLVLSCLSNALPRELSGGEAQRVAIARALAVDPPVLMMDEPTASLDPQRRAELGALLKGLADQGRAILVSTHDEEFARDWTTGILRLKDGAVTDASGPS